MILTPAERAAVRRVLKTANIDRLYLVRWGEHTQIQGNGDRYGARRALTGWVLDESFNFISRRETADAGGAR